ncbi:MAG TPA: hypothetical protein VFN23_08405 [Ktedonobacteraceae bacterium]|nr:hypothetical protein [Ktedonobacteraceae bacterium]
MNALKDLANHAASRRIRGRSYKRNSLLKPLDIILDELDRCPDTKNEEELELVWTGSKGLIFDHVKRIAKGVHEEDIYRYVDLFREKFFEQSQHRNANRILQRERLIRSAYLVYMREALAEIFVVRGKAKNPQEAMQRIEVAEARDEDPEEDE